MATFVLVHGYGGWCWSPVRHELIQLGHDVFTPTLTGLGDRRQSLTPEVCVETHIVDLVDLLYFEDLREVHVVFHSYAGILAGPVVERAGDRVATATFMGAFLVDNGQSLLDVEPTDVGDRYRKRAVEAGDGWRIPADDAFLSQWGVPEHLRSRVGRRLTDFPLRCLTDRVNYDAAPLERLGRYYVRHTDPPLESLNHSYVRAIQTGCKTYDIVCGHDMMLDDPPGTVALVLEIAGE